MGVTVKLKMRFFVKVMLMDRWILQLNDEFTWLLWCLKLHKINFENLWIIEFAMTDGMEKRSNQLCIWVFSELPNLPSNFFQNQFSIKKIVFFHKRPHNSINTGLTLTIKQNRKKHLTEILFFRFYSFIFYLQQQQKIYKKLHNKTHNLWLQGFLIKMLSLI